MAKRGFFDFSGEVRQAMYEAQGLASRLTVKTTVRRRKFSAAVRRAGFHFLSGGDSFAPGKHDLLIGAAPWSDADLLALDDVVPIVRSRDVQVTVFDIDDLPLLDMANLPGMRRFTRTPMIMQYRVGDLIYFGEGYDAVLWLRQF